MSILGSIKTKWVIISNLRIRKVYKYFYFTKIRRNEWAELLQNQNYGGKYCFEKFYSFDTLGPMYKIMELYLWRKVSYSLYCKHLWCYKCKLIFQIFSTAFHKQHGTVVVKWFKLSSANLWFLDRQKISSKSFGCKKPISSCA